MTSVWLKYDKNCILCKSSQAKKSQKPKSHKKPKHHKPSNAQKAKRLQTHPNPQTRTKFTNTHKREQTTQNKNKKNHAQKNTKTSKPHKKPKNTQSTLNLKPSILPLKSLQILSLQRVSIYLTRFRASQITRLAKVAPC